MPEEMGKIAEMIDSVLSASDNQSVISSVGQAVVAMMSERPIFAW